MLNITISQQEVELFVLIIVRIASFISIAPFWNESGVPQRFKLGFAIALAYLVYLLMPEQTPVYDTTLEYATLVIKESVVGLLIGFGAYVCSMVVVFAGRLVDMEIGMSMANLYDPSMKTQMSLTGSLYQRVFFMLLIISGMHLYLIGALVDTFEVIPVGGMQIDLLLLDTFIGFLGDYFIIGFRIILPIFAVILITNCAMGIMTKIAPQIHMFSVGMQLKILAGFLIMFLTVVIMPNISDFLQEEMKTIVVQVIKGLS